MQRGRAADDSARFQPAQVIAPMTDQTQFDRIISGAPAIAAALDRSERRIYRLLEQHVIPATKIGGVWTTTERTLIEHVAAKAKAGE